jgi:hypothetical protein
MGATIQGPASVTDSSDSTTEFSDIVLLQKLQSLQHIICSLEPESPLNESYSYEDFVNDLDVDDIYTRRLLELLVRETASKRAGQRAGQSLKPDVRSTPCISRSTSSTTNNRLKEPRYVPPTTATVRDAIRGR